MALFALYWIVLIFIAAQMAIGLWRRRSSVEIPLTFLAFVLLLAALSDFLVALSGNVSWSVELVINRVIAATWLILCAQMGVHVLQGGVRAAMLGEGNAAGLRQIASDRAVIRSAGIGVCCGATLVLWSVLVFSAGDAFGYHETIRTSADLHHLAFVTAAATRDEVVFRLGLQTFFGDRWRSVSAGTAKAIIASSIVFSIAHGGNFDLVLLKFAQIFPASCLLGIVFVRRGLVGSGAAHTGMNIGLALTYA